MILSHSAGSFIATFGSQADFDVLQPVNGFRLFQPQAQISSSPPFQARLQEELALLLKEEENRFCADCDSKGPRWASWNLGVFLCIRCAGIHRNLGVHISKVREKSGESEAKRLNTDSLKI